LSAAAGMRSSTRTSSSIEFISVPQKFHDQNALTVKWHLRCHRSTLELVQKAEALKLARQ
jgi:hypothetical protein